MSITKVHNPYRKVASPQQQTPQGSGNQNQQQARSEGGISVRPIQRHASRMDEVLYDQNGEFNPVRHGHISENQIREAVGGSTRLPRRLGHLERMFDDRGKIQGDNNGDTLTQVARLLNDYTRNVPMGAFRRESQMEKEARKEVLAAALQDPTLEGMHIVGQELLLPIKDILDYEGWSRKVYRSRPLNQGELFRIAKDVRSTAYVIGQDGQGLEARLHGKFIQPGEFKVTAFTSVDIEDIYQMNYDVLDRAQDTARQEIELEEDKRALALLDRAAVVENDLTIFATLGIAAFEAVRYQVERHRLVCDKFLINRQEVTDIVTTMASQVDPVTERELILSGYIGNILNCKVYTTAGQGVEQVIPAGSIYAVTPADNLGEMGIRVELFSEPYNKFSQQETVKGWAFIEIIGFGISNVRAVAKGTK